jgi:hypothetical protein
MGMGLLLKSKPGCLQNPNWMLRLYGVGPHRQIEDEI